MKFLAVATIFFAGVLAAPTTLDEHWANTQSPDGKACPDGLFANPQCCGGDILGIIGLDCSVPIKTIRDAPAFRQECASSGKQARCCVLPLAGQALLCQAPVGAN